MLLLFFLIIIALKSLNFYLFIFKKLLGLKSGLKLAEINNFNEGTLAVYEA